MNILTCTLTPFHDDSVHAEYLSTLTNTPSSILSNEGETADVSWTHDTTQTLEFENDPLKIKIIKEMVFCRNFRINKFEIKHFLNTILFKILVNFTSLNNHFNREH